MSAKPNGILPTNGTPCTPDSEDWESRLDSGELEASLDKLSIQPTGPAQTFLAQPLHQQSLSLYGDDPRTQYRPPEPVIKIMKRPDSGTISSQNGQARPRVEQKSLKQREQEYAEARQRILGNDSDSTTAKTPSKSVISKNKKDTANNTARHPKGPDGSKGFQSKR